MSSAELTDWIALYQLEPFGPIRDDLRIGILGMRLASCLATFTGGGPFLQDFMPNFDDNAASRYDTDEQMFAKLMAMTTNVQAPANG